MSTVSNKSEHPGQKAIEANPHKEGPHDPKVKSRIAKKGKSDSSQDEAYVVSVSARPKDEEGKTKSKVIYTPEEVRTKAKAFLNSPQLTAEERKVLSEILADKKA